MPAEEEEDAKDILEGAIDISRCEVQKGTDGVCDLHNNQWGRGVGGGGWGGGGGGAGGRRRDLTSGERTWMLSSQVCTPEQSPTRFVSGRCMMSASATVPSRFSTRPTRFDWKWEMAAPKNVMRFFTNETYASSGRSAVPAADTPQWMTLPSSVNRTLTSIFLGKSVPPSPAIWIPYDCKTDQSVDTALNGFNLDLDPRERDARWPEIVRRHNGTIPLDFSCEALIHKTRTDPEWVIVRCMS